MSTDLHLPVNLDGLDCFNTSINTDSLSCGNAIYLEGRFVSRRKEMEILSLERYFLIGEEILSLFGLEICPVDFSDLRAQAQYCTLPACSPDPSIFSRGAVQITLYGSIGIT
ncbi:hypothetical protein ZeamMp082 (mitochondrion) [Zea mays subsp. mays]|jgi:hypothetical protein|uniref:Uncharacterized protein orf111-a n=1 Tax=Zea mays TaxID=4577 RepID=Q6R9G4_MAIZE|nr:hypothetical protein ZeamMp082 [Zea mays subsp. mays]AAR91149.1 hypothetical protein [Zea mays]|eukprot:YP_588344.1 hypothetical protein ZeamMp082 (mitochondrion) [Zea mays subsp. mays]